MPKKKKNDLQEVEAALESSVDRDDSIKMGGLNTGSTMLNLACSGNLFQGFPIGHYTLLAGEAAAGKTFLAINALAEACLDSRFDEHALIYDNVENGCMFDLDGLFHPALKERLHAPLYENDEPVYSGTVEEFYYNVSRRLASPKPFIYVLDSMDALSCDADDEKFQEQKKAHESGKQISGTYGTGKALLNSKHLRNITGKSGLRKNGSILIILAQVRDNLAPMTYEKKSRSGGKALRFYASMEAWAKVKKQIKKTVSGNDREIGVSTLWQVKKNRTTGLLREAAFDIYPSYGIDDIGACVDFLIEEGRWVGKSKIDATDLGVTASRGALIKHIEETPGAKEILLTVVQEQWDNIEEACKLKRVKRYGV